MPYPIITTMEQFSGVRANKPETKALWHLFDGTFTDDSGNGFHGTVTGGSLIDDGLGITLNGAYVDVTSRTVWNPAFNFQGDWELSTAHPYSGTYCYRSKPMTPTAGQSKTSAVTFTVDVPVGSAGELKLQYYVSSEADYDKFYVKVDGAIQSGFPQSGTVPWTALSIPLTEGTHTVELSYVIDGATSVGENAAFVDDIEFLVDGVSQAVENFDSVQIFYPIMDMQDWTIGGWIRPTAEDVANQWAMIATTRSGSGESPIFHLALNYGVPHVRLYSDNVDQVTDSNIYGSALVSGQEYFIALSYNWSAGKLYLTVNDTTVEVPLAYDGANKPPTELRARPLSFGHMDGAYKYTGWMSDWFLEYKFNTSQELKEFYLAGKDVVLQDIDYITSPGSIQLAKNPDGTYVPMGVYESPIIDLQNPFPQLGKVKIIGNAPYGYTSIIAKTRTSSDGVNFSDWEPVDSESRILSPNYRYIQLRLELYSNDGEHTPIIDEIMFEDTSPDAIINMIRVVPKVYDNNGRHIANLNKLKSLVLNDENNGEETLTFTMAMDEKAKELVNEYRVDLVDENGNPYNRFYIRDIEDDIDEHNKKIRTFMCEAAWYDLATKPVISMVSFLNSYPDQPLNFVLAGTGWTVDRIDAGFEIRDYVVQDKKNPLQHLKGIQEVWGGDLVFDNVNQTVSLLRDNIEVGYAIRRRKNMKSIKRKINTQGLITKLTPYGANDLSIASANNGIPYIENYSWFTDRGLQAPVKEAEWKDERFYNAYHLKERAIEKLEELSVPTVSYEIGLLDLSSQPRFAHEIPLLRTQAIIDEEDLDEQLPVKIIARELDLLEPWKSKLSLSTRIKELGDEGASLSQEAEGRLDDADAVDRTEMQELMVFNYLQNSRADNGWNSWVKNGNIEIDNTNGVSGKNSFKLIGGGPGTKQELQQTIWPSTRENYTLSAQIATENLQKHDDAKVGIKVTITYDDGTKEDQYLEL
ncbi:minor tail protein [Weizmannia phage Youna2]